MDYTIRRATRRDVPAINEILNYSIENELGNVTHETRSAEKAYEWYDAHDGRHPVFVLEEDGTICAWGSLSVFRASTGYDTTTEHSVYVRNGCRGRGYGEAIMKTLMAAAPECGFDQMMAVVTASNAASIALHKKLGFKETGLLTRAAYKNGMFLDIMMLQWTVCKH